MCSFLSCISDGKGRTLFFKLEDIVNEIAKGNPKSYEWNSHTSIANFNGISSKQEDKWNKWEYNVEKKEIKADSLVTTDDSPLVKVEIEKYLEGKNVLCMQNLYNWNSGNWNSGNWNSGNRNSGDGNSGDGNSGNGNSGDGNSGNWNSGILTGHFCAKKLYFLFDKPCSEKDYKKVYDLNIWQYLNLCQWVLENDMTPEEKEKYPMHKTLGGYLKTISYKEAWALVPKEKLQEIKKLKNYNKKKFKEITGLEI